jgi:hypothetical protein
VGLWEEQIRLSHVCFVHSVLASKGTEQLCDHTLPTALRCIASSHGA